MRSTSPWAQGKRHRPRHRWGDMADLGRPSKFKDVVPSLKQIERMAAKGFTNMDFAEVLGVSHSTIDAWLAERPDFSGAIKRGRDIADRKVEKSLYQRALGFKHKAVKIFQYEGVPVLQEYMEQYPPDTMAAMYWLNNRQPKDWRHKQTVETINTPTRPLQAELVDQA